MTTPSLLQNVTPSQTNPYHSNEDEAYLSAITPSTIFLHDGVLRSLNLKTLKEFEQHAKYQDALTISSTDQMEELMAIGLNSSGGSGNTGNSSSLAGQNKTNNPGNATNASAPVSELSRKILKLSTWHVQAIGLHHRYQWHVLEKQWLYKQSLALHRRQTSDASKQSHLNALTGSSQQQDSTTPERPLGFKLSLCLLVPMMEMYANQNTSVALSSLKLLFEELSAVPVTSLNHESSHSLEKLEDLLANWASNSDAQFQTVGPSAMVALACARGAISSFAKTILMLENLESPMRFLPVATILKKLNDSRAKTRKPCGIQGEGHLATWPYDDRLSMDSLQGNRSLGTKTHASIESSLMETLGSGGSPEGQESSMTPNRLQLVPTTVASPVTSPTVGRQTGTNSSPNANNTAHQQEEFHRRFVASDGAFLFVTGPDGKGLSKMGSGLRGTLQGWIYQNNVDLNCGFLVYSEGHLISRLQAFDKIIHSSDQIVFGVTINPLTLKPDRLVLIEAKADDLDEVQKRSCQTLGMTSDGSLIYIVKADLSPREPGETGSSQAPTPVPIYLDIWKLVHDPHWPHLLATPKTLRIPLSHKTEDMTGPGPSSDRNSTTISGGGTGVGTAGSSGNDDRSIRRTRSVRITPPPPPPPPPPMPSNAAGGAQDNSITTLGVSLKQLQTGIFIACGNYLTIIASTNTHFFVQTASSNTPTVGPVSTLSASYRQYSPVMSNSVSRVLGTQFHYCLDSSLGGFPQGTKEDFSNLPADCSFFHGGIIPETGAAYDPFNNLIWTCNGSFVDIWKNPGHIPPWKLNHILLLGNSLNEDLTVSKKDGQNCDVRTVINVMTRHIGIMASNFLHGDMIDANIGFREIGSGNGSVLKSLIELIIRYRGNFYGPEMSSVFLSLQALVSQIKEPLDMESKLHENLYSVQVLILCFLNDPNVIENFEEHKSVYTEACKLFAQAFDLLYTTPQARSDFFKELYDYFDDDLDYQQQDEDMSDRGSQEGSSTSTRKCVKALKLLKEYVLKKFTENLNDPALVHFEEGNKWVVDIPWLVKILHEEIDDMRNTLSEVSQRGFAHNELIKVSSTFPKTSVAAAYIEAVVNFFLRCLITPGSGASALMTPASSSAPTSTNFVLKQGGLADAATETFREILKAGPATAETFLEFLSAFEGTINLALYNCTEALIKSSVLANGIPEVLCFLSLESLPQSTRHLLDELTEECIQLTVAMSFLASKLNSSGSSPSTSDSRGKEIGDDWSSRVKIFSPWNTKRSFESTHPIRESFKAKETIVIPNARQLYLKFTPQSATQYDYDRLTFYQSTGATTSSAATPPPKKIAEFGGNYYGFGNRFFSGPGWSRALTKLTDSNSVSFSFEMKSGREHSVPDKALWGYQFTIFPVFDYSDQQKPPRSQEDTESMNPVGTAFSTISALHCVDVIQNLARMLLEGSAPTLEEKNNRNLLENRLLASLKFSTPPNKPGSEGTPIPRKFSQDLITKLKRAVGVSPLQMRLSIIEKMRAPELEELYLQCCMQHIGTNPYLNAETVLSPICESCWGMEPTRDLLREIFHNIDSLFRRIMAFYEMEKMLSQEVEEISAGTKDISEVFFNDPSFLENTQDLQTLAWICYLDYDKENPMNLINDVTQMVTALAADGTPATLTRTDELIEETHQKCKFLLRAVPSSSSHSIYYGPTYPSQKLIHERIHNINQFLSAHMLNPSCTIQTFVEAMRTRRERAGDRIKGLDILHKVLECSSPSSSLLIVSSILLQSGPRLQTIMCSGLEQEVIKIFGEVLKTAVGIAEKNPLLHRYSIALLSITQYDRTDEENLVESGLVGLLDQLCAYQTGHLTPLYQRGSPTETSSSSKGISPEMALLHYRASTLAWAAFQVLAGQCASWEKPTSSKKSSSHPHHHHHHYSGYEDPSEWDEPEHRELPLQISINITNHLARAAALAALSSPGIGGQPSFMDDNHYHRSLPLQSSSTCSQSLSAAIQDVLDLLNNLRTYKIGRAILKQSPCICRLLGLLQDSRLSPRLVMTILKLLHTALPLVDHLDTANFKQIVPMKNPAKGGSGGSPPISSFWTVIESTPYTQVASMLLSKLADYLVCGTTTSNSSGIAKGPGDSQKGQQCSPSSGGGTSQPSTSSPPAILPPYGPSQGLIDPAYDRMEVWVHKAPGEHQNPTAALIRQLFVDAARQDLRPSRGTLNELENELNANGKALLYSEESSLAERKALRISQLGHLVTMHPSGWSRTPHAFRGVTNHAITTSSSKGPSDILCKERNSHLSAWDPARPFLSGHVAENLSSEIVQLVRELLTSARKDSWPGSTGLSGCSSRANVHSGSSTTSVASTIGAASVCTGGDTESLVSEASAQLRVSSKPSQWPSAVEQVLCAALKLLPRLMSIQNPTNAHIESYVYSARLIISALTVLGGFTETIRSGLEVWIVEDENKRESREFAEEDQMEWEYKATRARVISVSDTSPTAKVEILSSPPPGLTMNHTNSGGSKGKQEGKDLSVSDILNVPVSRLVPGHYTKCGMPNLPNLSRMAQIDLANFLKTLLVIPGGGSAVGSKEKEYPLKRQLPTLNQIVTNANSAQNSESRQIAQSMTIVRLLAEIRTKAMQVLSLWLKRKEFCDIFLGIGSESQFSTKKYSNEVLEASENLKELSKQCIPSHKPLSLETQVAWMRLLYRDCTKPPRLPLNPTDKLLSGEDSMRWDLSRQFPKIKSTVFSSVSNSLVYTGDYNVSSGNPRGLVLFGNGPVSQQGFYWEATIVTMEDLGQHADLIVIPPLSIGFSPMPTNPSGGNTNNDMWKYSSGTVMYTTLGRVVHYKTQDPGSWVTLRLDDDSYRIKAGDTVGIGWEKWSSGPIRSVGRGRGAQAQSNRGNPSPNADLVPRGRGGVRLNRGSNMITLDTQTLGNGSSLSPNAGRVYFTLNGRRLTTTVEQANCNLYPIIHVQKRQMIVQTNLGERPFLYAEANKVNKPKDEVSPTLTPTRGQGARGNSDTADAGTSNADVLLRRVSDSLQDLNLVFNINLNELESDPELRLSERSWSNETLSGVSNNSTAGSRSRRGDHEEDDEWDHHIDADDDDDDDDDGDAQFHDDDDDDSDARDMAMSESNIPRDNPAFRLLPSSPVAGVSSSRSGILAMRRPPRPQSARPLSSQKKSPGPGTSSRKSPGVSNSITSMEAGLSSKKNEVIAKPTEKMVEYNPTKSLEYFMAHSPTTGIKVFQGPRRYVCPCASHCPTPLDFLLLDGGNGSGRNNQDSADRKAELESLDSYEDDEDDDIHSLLVKAWEQTVFPVIRRRFRNESERRDGLEQIRGALQLGMLDIARQTVEFLYEEGGGPPRDLHFPTLEEIRTEAVKCTMDKLKAGMNVIIRPFQQDQGVLPNFAVTSMLRTFGLVGEVLEVDLQHDLVLVETYIESEGVLVRFWYPVSCLDKTQTSKRPTLSTNTVNMFKLHSHLISMEGSLCHLYSRACYLAIARRCISPHSDHDHDEREDDPVVKKKLQVATQIFNHFDLDSIQILSDNLLSNYPPSRDLLTCNLQGESPSLKFLLDPGNPSVIFYNENYDILAKILRQKIRELSKTQDDSLDKLTNHLLRSLDAPEKFLRYELQLDRIFDVDVYLPNMAFTLVSFKGSQMTKQMNSLDNTIHPCLHVSSYDSSEICRHLMACYPLEPLHVLMHRASSASNEDGSSPIISHAAPTSGASSSSAAAALNKTLRKRHARFPPILCPADRVHCSVSEINLPDVTTDIQGIPKEFPLALLYIQTLVEEFHTKENKNLSFSHVTNAVTHLLDFLDHIHVCPVIKDWIFTLVAELTRVRSQDDLQWTPGPSEKIARSCTPNRLLLELLLLRDKETSEQNQLSHMAPIIAALNDHLDASTSKAKQFAPGTLMFHISNFILNHQKSTKSPTDPNFSFYFNSLNDLCLALNEISEIMVNPYEIIPCAPPSNDPSPTGSPQKQLSTTDSGLSIFPGSNTGLTTAAGAPTAAPTTLSPPTNKRVLAKAVRRRTTPATKENTKHSKDTKKGGGGGTSSGSGGSSSQGEKGNRSLLASSASEDGMLTFAKASEIEWFNNQVIITRVLKDIVWYSPNDHQCVEASQVLIGTVLEKLKAATIHSRLLVIQGAPVNIDGMSIEASLIRALRGCGGIHGNEMWISGNSAVVEIRSLAKVNEAYDLLRQNKVWYPLEDYVLYPNVTVYKVNESFKVTNPSASSVPASSNSTAAGTSSSSGGAIALDGDQILRKYLLSKIAESDVPERLNFLATEVLSGIFMSCYGVSIPFTLEEDTGSGGEEMESGKGRGGLSGHHDRNRILLTEEQITLKIPGNLLEMFTACLIKSSDDPEGYLRGVLNRYGEKMRKPKVKNDKNSDKQNDSETKDEKAESCGMKGNTGSSSEDEVCLSHRGFLNWCTDLLKDQVNLLWKAILSAGYDLRLDQVMTHQDPSLIYNYFHDPDKWSLEKDAALIQYVDQFAQTLHIDPTRIQPQEVYLTESDFLNPSFQVLQGVDIAYLRVRWGMFQKMNTLVAKKFLPLVSLHTAKSTHRSLGRLLHDSRQLLLYYTKDMFLYKVIQVSASRGSDTATPEISIDPVSSIGTQDESVLKNQLSQIIQQMSTITTAFYCVPPAQGADPALPLSVKFQGEEVLGLSGSFRHFMLNAAKELQSEAVKLLCRCPSSDAGRNKDSFIVTPGKLSYGEEDFLHFMGQLIGISIRSDAPLALPLLKATWRALLLSEKECNDSTDDLIEVDVLCATYLNKLESFSTKMAFDNFLSLNAWPKFQYPSMDNSQVVPLCPDGASITVSFANRDQFVKLIRQLREKELRSTNKVTKILTGLSTIVPLPALLGLFTSDHLELRIAGSPEVNLSLLKSHTHYQVGVSENDPHIMYFWAALESFTPEELKKFIKFAANLERLPVTCPCQALASSNNETHHQHHHPNHQQHHNNEHHHHPQQESSSSNTVHVPPFPMKIAPIDVPPSATTEEIDKRLIRVETCLFLIRLPPYSTLQVTRQQLLFAINCREDPLSG